MIWITISARLSVFQRYHNHISDIFKHILLDSTYFSQFTQLTFTIWDGGLVSWGMGTCWHIVHLCTIKIKLISHHVSLLLSTVSNCPRSVIFFISTLWLSPLPLSSSFQAFLLDCAERFQVFLWQHLWHRLRINYLCNNWKCQRMLQTFFFGFIYLLWNSGPPISNPVLIF